MQDIQEITSLRATFFLLNPLTNQRDSKDSIAFSSSAFAQHFFLVSDFIGPDGKPDTTAFLEAFLALPSPGPDQFFGGFLFDADDQPWGYKRTSASISTADYISYAGQWMEAAAKATEGRSTTFFSIYGYKFSLERQGAHGLLRDMGDWYGTSHAPPLMFPFFPFFWRFLEQCRLYQDVVKDLTNRLQQHETDTQPGASSVHLASHLDRMLEGFPTFDLELQKLEQASKTVQELEQQTHKHIQDVAEEMSACLFDQQHS